MPANTDVIAQIEQVKQLESLVTENIFARVNLHTLPRALQMRKARFSHQAIADEAAGNANFALFGLKVRRRCGRIFLNDARRRLRRAKFARKRINSQCSDLLEFFLALLKLVAWLKFQSGKNPFRRSRKYIGACTTRARNRRRSNDDRSSSHHNLLGTSIDSARRVSLLFS